MPENIASKSTLSRGRIRSNASGKLVDATDLEIEAAVLAVVTALKHPVMARAVTNVGNGRVRRKTPVMLRDAHGTLVEGVRHFAKQRRRSSGF
jgi:hypothetical protein